VNEAAEVIRGASIDDTNIIFGATVDERLEGQVWVTVIVTGVGQRGGSRIVPRPENEGSDTLEPPSFLQS
jgi:cell division protein FtsZ